jgi:hypothetical protein
VEHLQSSPQSSAQYPRALRDSSTAQPRQCKRQNQPPEWSAVRSIEEAGLSDSRRALVRPRSQSGASGYQATISTAARAASSVSGPSSHIAVQLVGLATTYPPCQYISWPINWRLLRPPQMMIAGRLSTTFLFVRTAFGPCSTTERSGAATFAARAVTSGLSPRGVQLASASATA